MKKLAYILCLALLLTACGVSPPPTQTPTAPPPSAPEVSVRAGEAHATVDGKREVRWLIPTLLSPSDYELTKDRIHDMLERVNEHLSSRAMYLTIELRQTVIEGDINDKGLLHYSMMNDMFLLLTSGERYDLISLPVGHVSIVPLVQERLIQELSTEIPQYANLHGVLDPNTTDTLRRLYNGIYGIPAGFDLRAGIRRSYLAVDGDVLDQLGVASVDTSQALLEAAREAKRRGLPYRVYFDLAPDMYRREYPQFPFKVSDDFLFVYFADGTVTSYLDSEIIEQDAYLAGEIRELNGEKLGSLTGATNRGEIQKPHFDFATGLNSMIGDPNRYLPVKFAQGAPQILYDNPFGKVFNVIPASAGDSLGLELLDALYGDAELYGTFRDESGLFGVSEGYKPYFLTPATTIWRITDYGLGVPYDVANFGKMMDAYFYSLYDCVRQTPSTSELNRETNLMSAVYADIDYASMPWDGFRFDPSAVQTLYQEALTRQMQLGKDSKKNILSVLQGDSTINDVEMLRADMKRVGLDELVAECQRQYAAFLEAKR